MIELGNNVISELEFWVSVSLVTISIISCVYVLKCELKGPHK